MPHLKKPRKVEPLWHAADYKAQKKGLRHTVYSVNGDQYTGEWLDNERHGKGTMVYKESGSIYDGGWKNGLRSGFGTLSFPDKVSGKYKKQYSGGWRNDKKQGYGTFYYSDTEYYEGEWVKDMRSGWGRMYYSDGSIFEGEWKDDKECGRGMFRLASENRYEGEWRNGKKNGRGKFYYLDTGQVYEGVWVDGIAKCGTMVDFLRESAPEPTMYPIPHVDLEDADNVLEAAEQSLFRENEI